MNYQFNHIIEVINKDGQLIWKIPHKTLLDTITDLWPLITDYYYNYYPFALGKMDDLYNNYRLTTRAEVNTSLFTKSFKTNYELHGGIYSLSSGLVYGSYVHNLSGSLYIDYHNIYVTDCKSKFINICSKGWNIHESTSLIRCGLFRGNGQTGLFVLDNLQLL